MMNPNTSDKAQLTIEVKSQLNQIVDALLAVCPSRNYISQFLLDLPNDYAKIYDGFPDFLGDPTMRGKLQQILGLQIGPQITLKSDGFGEKLLQILSLTFELFSDDTLHKEMNDFLKAVRTEAVSNPLQEWAIAKIRAAIGDEQRGKMARAILTSLRDFETIPSQVSPSVGPSIGITEQMVKPNNQNDKGMSFQNLNEILKLPRAEILEVVQWLATDLRLISIESRKGEDGIQRDTIAILPNIRREWLKDIF